MRASRPSHVVAPGFFRRADITLHDHRRADGPRRPVSI